MLGLILGGAQVAGGIAGFLSGRKEKKHGRRRARRAQRRADERLENQDGIISQLQDERGFLENFRGEEIARHDRLGFDQIEQDLADQVRDGVDVEGRADTAGAEFTNEFDVSLDAAERALLSRGVDPGSSAHARLREDAAFDRARGAATASNESRRHSDDLNFARRVAYADRGAQSRTNILNQSGNIAAGLRAEFGAEGEIRGQFLSERNHQQQRAENGRQAMAAGATAIGSAGVGLATQGAFGDGAQQYAMDYIRRNNPTTGTQ